MASAFQPNKMANSTEVVGALHQDRHSGIMGVLGDESPMIPVTLKVRSLDANEKVQKEKDFKLNVFVHQKWTPYLMMLTLYNSLSQLNEFADEATYRMKRQRPDERHAEHRDVDDAGLGRGSDARADGAGRLVGRQVQPPVPEQREDSGCEERQRDGGPAAGAPRSPRWRTPGSPTPRCVPARM